MGNHQQQLTTNEKVLMWVRGEVGKQVGKGECWDLGEQALKHAGAQTSNDLGPVEEDSDYVWGDPVELKDIGPGDILQIRDHAVTTTTETTYTFPDGSEIRESKDETAVRPHHTAIVNGSVDAEGAVRTLEQHVKPLGKRVQNKKLYTRDVPSVVTTTHEKRTNPGTQKTEMAKVTKTVTITVTGTIWAYRPKPK